MRDVTAVVASYESAGDLPLALESLRAQTHPPAEILVVDAGSADASVDIARAHGARAILAENRGLGHLYNKGAEAARSELVLLANADVELEPDCLRQLVEALEADPRRFAADPRQLDWTREHVIHARTLLRRGTHRDPIPGLRLASVVEAAENVTTLFANAGTMLVDRARLRELGGFDEAFFIDYEDLDLCWRAWLRGWESVYVPAATLRHRVGASTGATPVRRRRLVGSHHNILRFALKCLPARAAAVVVAGELVRLVRHPTVLAPAIARILADLPAIVRLRRVVHPTRKLYEWQLAGQPGGRP